MTAEHTVNHLSSVAGVTLLVYAVWSILLSPGKGPLPGTVLPAAVGLVLFAVGAGLFAWGASRIYGYE